MPDPITLDSQTELKIGFPPPLLGNEPVRLPVAQPGEGLIALTLPGGVISDAHPFYPGALNVVASLQAQLRAEKPELTRLGMEAALGVNFIEPEVSGLLLVGVTRPGIEKWRNAFGSSQLSFTYEFVALANDDLGDEVVCDLPVARHKARHKSESRMLISHKTGKKCRTEFRRLARQGGYDLWSATTVMPRVHQIRLHAMEVGLSIPGESRYGETPALTWSAFEGKGKRGDTSVIEERPLVHLARVEAALESLGLAPAVAPLEGRMGRLWAAFSR